MNRWLKDNPVGLGLAALCGALLLTMLVLAVVASLPVDRDSGGDESAGGEEGLALPELGESPPIEEFYVITERPLFNETRQPVLDEGLAGDLLADGAGDAEDNPLDVELSGVVITPSLRLAMLRKKDAGRSLVAFEGKPIEGEFSSWQVSRIEAREVLLTSGSGEELQLKLKVHDEQIAPPQRAERKPAAREPGAAPAESAAEPTIEEQPMTRADEIRQRIAERREELRREAEMEQQGSEQLDDEQSAAPSYQEAIQSLIGRNRRGNGDNQDNE